MPPLTPAALVLLAANLVVFLVARSSPDLAAMLALWPIGDQSFEPWQPLSYGFLHIELDHLLLNMFALWMFGADLERVWGHARFVVLWLASVVAAGLTQLVVDALLGVGAPTLGASGGVFGLLLAFALLFPTRRVLVFFVVPMQARWFALLYGLIELFQGVWGLQSGVAHFAHLGGMLGAWLTMLAWRHDRRR